MEQKKFEPPVREEDKDKTDTDNDYKYSRENYYNLIEKDVYNTSDILDVAKEAHQSVLHTKLSVH